MLNLLRVESHVILSISEINSESENLKFNEFIDNTENSPANNFELHHNETSEDSGKFEFTPTFSSA